MALVEVERPEEGIGHLVLNRPERRNALAADLLAAFSDALDEVEADRSIRVVVISGAGAGFCAGADLKESVDPASQKSKTALGIAYDMQIVLANLMLRLHELRQPVIAAVHGPAVGGGLAIALASDVRVCDPTALFGAVFIKVGLSSCDVGTSYLLPRIVGAARAAELMLTGRHFDASEAERIGLVHQVSEPGAHVEAALSTARLIAENNEYGVWMTKSGLWANLDAPSMRHAIELENRTQILGTFTGNMEEATKAFREKRVPKWGPV